MEQRRLDLVAAALADESGPPILERLLDVCVEELALGGAGIAIVGDRQHRGVVAATSLAAAQVDDLQFGLGEGPALDVDLVGRGVIEPDLATTTSMWPAFAPAAMALGVRAVFAFPLGVGALRLGVLSMYRATAGELDAVDLADAASFAHIATNVLLDLEAELAPGALPVRLAQVDHHRRHVHQATGMIAAQLNSDVATALSRLRAFAWSADRTIDDVAGEVVARRVRFDQ